MAATSASELLERARRRLAEAPFQPSTREARLLLGHVLGRSEAALLAHPEQPVSRTHAERFHRLLDRRLAGEPVAYLLGFKEFFGRRFAVDRRVLIPRPETEHLVEAALELELPPGAQLLDLGTGSGCLAVTLALERPRAAVTAVDLSPGALAVASANARSLGARVRFVGGDLARAVALDRFRLVVSNPPYIGREEADQLSPEITAYEPGTALFAANAGLSVLARLLDELAGLPAGAVLLLEIGFGQSEALAARARDSAFELLAIRPDYAGVPRVAVLRRVRRVAVR